MISKLVRTGAVLGLLSSFCALSLEAQTLPPRISEFLPSSYDGHPQVYCAEAGPEGQVAFGTKGMILLYDGEELSKIPIDKGSSVFALAWGARGRLYVGGRALIGIVTPDSTGSWQYRSLLHRIPEEERGFGSIRRVKRVEKGIYFNSHEELFFLQGDSLSTLKPQRWFKRIYRPADRLLVQDLDSGVFWLDGKKKERIEGLEGNDEWRLIEDIFQDPGKEGTWVVFTQSSGLFRLSRASWKVTPFPKPSLAGPQNKLLAKSNINKAEPLDPSRNPYGASFVVGTNLNGVFFMDEKGRVLMHLGREKGLASEHVWDIEPDGWGNVWVTTNKGMSLLHTGSAFTLLPEGETYTGSILDIGRPSGKDKEANFPLFFATSQGTWGWSFEKEAFQMLSMSEGTCLDLLIDPASYKNEDLERSLLIAGGGRGIIRTSPISEDELPDSPDIPMDGHVVTLSRFSFPKGKERLIFGGSPGFSVFSRSEGAGDEWAKEIYLDSLPQTIVSLGWDTVSTSPDSVRIWASMSTKGVLELLADTGLTGYRVEHHRAGKELPDGKIRILKKPNGHGVLFGTEKGLYKWTGASFQPSCRFTKPLCKGTRTVHHLEAGPNGTLWVQKGEKVERLLPEEEGYRADSLPFRALDLGVIRAIHAEAGKTWLGGDRGLACYHPEVDIRMGASWECRIKKVFGGGDSLLFGGRFFANAAKGNGGKVPIDSQPPRMVPTLPYEKGRFLFEYAARFPERQDAVRYRCKLEGFDTAWSKARVKTEKEYTNLPEGHYTFKVRAENVFGYRSSTASYSFRVLPPWYRTWWAYGGYGIGGFAFLCFVVWLNGKRLRAQKRRLERIVEERTQEIREKNANLEKANEQIQNEKEKVEAQHRETNEQKKKVEEAHGRLQEAHKEITQSIDYAQKIQYALLQSEDHISPHLPEHFVLFKPQAKVSGDFYWAREHQGYLYIAAVDCTGHGVPGAFMSMLGISQLNEIMNTEELPSPGWILTELRDRVVRELSGSDPESQAKDGMDAAILRIPITDGEERAKNEGLDVRFAGAQNPLYVLRKGIADAPPPATLYTEDSKGRVEESLGSSFDQKGRFKPFKEVPDGIEVKGDPMPVGYDEHAQEGFTTVSLELQKGDICYIFSDGYADQFGGPKGKKFRYGPFKKLLAQVLEKPMEGVKKELDRTFEEWKGEQEQIDDVVVIGVRL